LALLLWMVAVVSREDRANFEMLAMINARFINETGLPRTERMARQLGEVLGVTVRFRPPGGPAPGEAAAGAGVLRRAEQVSVAVTLASGEDMVFSRPAFAVWGRVWQPRTFAVLLAFWSLALGVGWMVSRSLVLPLRHLASRLPEIEVPGAIDLPEASRSDEIGDLARAFLRTRAALQREKIKREQAEKMAVLGRMTAALAHEIQNPVAAIKMHAELAAWDGGGEVARVIASEAERIENLVNQWMFLSRPEPPVLAPVALRGLCESLLGTWAPRLQHAQVEARLQVPDGCCVMADGRRLLQVFSNLIANAIQAMPLGGQLEISALPVPGWVEVEIRDGGTGFSATALSRFAEFFYSEKEGGMGIGLSVASEIVKAHGGELSAGNHPGGGAVVKVRLPAVPS
jgi:signal transduction histidine kinase